MTDTHPIYVACASGNNAQTDVLVTRHGDLVRLLGHPQMDFTASDAARLAETILETARACGWTDPPLDDGK